MNDDEDFDAEVQRLLRPEHHGELFRGLTAETVIEMLAQAVARERRLHATIREVIALLTETRRKFKSHEVARAREMLEESLK